jgi:hypothetical protein
MSMNQMRYMNHWISRKSNMKVCCFCDEPIHHVKKTKEGKVFICECGASFIYPVRERR